MWSCVICTPQRKPTPRGPPHPGDERMDDIAKNGLQLCNFHTTYYFFMVTISLGMVGAFLFLCAQARAAVPWTEIIGNQQSGSPSLRFEPMTALNGSNWFLFGGALLNSNWVYQGKYFLLNDIIDEVTYNLFLHHIRSHNVVIRIISSNQASDPTRQKQDRFEDV